MSIKIITTATILVSLALLSAGHAGHHERRTDSQQVAHTKRINSGSKCASHAAAMMRERKFKRGLEAERKQNKRAVNVTSDPQYVDSIQNSTCVLQPEVTEGPYYLNGVTARSNITDGQTGVPLVLDIGVLDTNTCEPLTNALVEIWHCNATGSYSGYTTDSTMSGVKTDALSFLRGGMATDDNGLVEFSSIYPGYYTSRTVHIHTFVHTNYSVADNGTIDSTAGTVVHIGQMFFDDSFTTSIYNEVAAYNGTSQQRTFNDEDMVMEEEATAGNNPVIDASWFTEGTVTDGVLGYITIGVDSTASQSITNQNWAGRKY